MGWAGRPGLIAAVPPLQLTTGSYGRPRLDLPAVRLVNAYAEASKGGPSEVVRTARPGLTQALNIGSGPILRTFQQPGVFNSAVFNVSGGSLYMGATDLGTVPYGQTARMAAANGQLAIVTGGALYCYTAAGGLRLIEFFNDYVSLLPPFSGVSVLYDIFIFPVVGSNQFFFSAVGDCTNINAANFSAAQTSPTPIVESAVLAEEIYFFKTAAGIEIWDYQGQLTAPFALSQGRTYARGCAAQGSVAQLDNALFWVGDDFIVYRTSTVPQRVSTSLIEDRLKKTGSTIGQITAFPFNLEGHVYYVLNLPTLNESYAYDCQTQEWAQWGTQYGLQPEPGVFIGQTAAGYGDAIYIGSSIDGRVWNPDETNRTDDGIPMRVVVSGAKWIDEGIQRCNNLTLHMTRGVATPTTPAPIVEMRWSDDGGRTWTSWLPGSIGPIGGYAYKASWHSLGAIQQPGREFEFAISDPVLVAIQGAAYNTARP